MMIVSPTLAKVYEGPASMVAERRYVVSEKLDGMRAIGNRRGLFTRNSKPIAVPLHILATLPDDIMLDGELWCGRGKFPETMSITRKKQPDAGTQKYLDWCLAWQSVQFMVFDEYGGSDSWLERSERAKAAIQPGPFAEFLQHDRVSSPAEFDAYFTLLINNGAEGAMLRDIDPFIAYIFDRTPFLLKRKPVMAATVRVVGHQQGKGKHEHRLGALLCQMPDGQEFGVGTGLVDQERENPPAIGCLIDIEFMEITRAGVPRFPVFRRVHS